jgi:hypothetical protein
MSVSGKMMLQNWPRKSSISLQRKNGARGATMPVSANKITCGWNLLLTIFQKKIVVNLQSDSDNSSCSSSEEEEEEVAEEDDGELRGIEAL